MPKSKVTKCPRIIAIQELLEKYKELPEDLRREEIFKSREIFRFSPELRQEFLDKAIAGNTSCDRNVQGGDMCSPCYLRYHQDRSEADKRYEREKRVKKPMPKAQQEHTKKLKAESAFRRQVNERLAAKIAQQGGEISPVEEVQLRIRIEREIERERESRRKKYNSQLTYKGRTQTIGEWAKEIGVYPFEIAARLQIDGLSLDDVLSPDSLPSWKILGIEQAQTPKNAMVQRLRFVIDAERQEDQKALQAKIEERIDDKDARIILKRRFFENASQSQIGRELKLSRERIRQIESAALLKLYEEYLIYLSVSPSI